MPEGPEIRRLADRLADAIVGQTAERVRFDLPRLAGHEGELDGRRVESIEPRGKALLTRFENDRILYSHNQLYGRWYVTAPGKLPKTGRSLRVAIETPKRWALLYSASDIELLHPGDLEFHPFLASLGPDLLDARTTPAKIRTRLVSRRFRGRALGGLLLDQGFLAGVGNYLRSEILFFAGLRPEARPKDLSDDDVAKLARAARTVTLRSYRTGGVTEEPEPMKRAKAAGEPRRSWRHAVFNRAGATCRRCSSVIQKLSIAGRRLYVCTECQGGPPG